MNIVDDFMREARAIEVDTSLSGLRVTRILKNLKMQRGLPGQIRSDNGPEFTSRALDQWAYEQGIRWHYIQPRRPFRFPKRNCKPRTKSIFKLQIVSSWINE